MKDVFISYRRRNGEAWASLIKGLLHKRGVDAYLDKHKKKVTDFKESLFKNIEQAPNFLLILSEAIFEKRDDEIDWVKEEILHARSLNKNIIAVITNGYNPDEVDWEYHKDISFLKTFECLKYDDTNIPLRDASIDSIIHWMVDEKGKPWKKEAIDNNNWYGGESISDSDRLWMTTSNEVCLRLDQRGLIQILKNPAFINRKEINYFSFLCYEVPGLKKKFETLPLINNNLPKFNVYGMVHSYDLKEANETFGEDHFVNFIDENAFEDSIKIILKNNHVDYFDIVDFSLVLKDCRYPEKVLRVITKYLNPQGGAIYIRDLDDDYVNAYPDEKGYINRLKELLALDPGAGNRHFGQKIYTYLLRSGADEVRMLDEVVTTANMKVNASHKMLDAYFSYLIPEFDALVEKENDNEDYMDAQNWLDMNYRNVEALFATREFYFRSGYIAGFGIYIDEEQMDEFE